MKFVGIQLSRERIVWILITLALVISVLVLWRIHSTYDSRLADALEWERAMTIQIEDVKDSLKETQELLQLEQKSSAGLPKLYDWELKRLREKGLEDPVNDLIADLMEHPELIPYQGILGGQMGFYSANQIHVLTPKWVFASFDDGHMSGHMFLEYQVSPGGRISWRVVDSYIMD
jgi:hypothetical protein